MSFRFPRMRRRTFALSAVVTVALALAGCSSSTTEAKPSAAAPAQSSAGSAAYPITIKHALGEAVIKEQPKRVVTLGQGSAETAIALGVIPVGIESYEWGSDPKTGYLPWIHEAVTKAGGTLPKQFAGGENIDFDTIVELDPDVILAVWSGVTKEQYEVLSGIAPTVAYPDLPWSTDWDQQITTVATALGKAGEGPKLIEQVKKVFADAAATRPQYKGVTFSYIYTTGPGTLGVFKPSEQRVAFLTMLGLTVDPVVETFKETEGTDSALIGLENAQKLKDSDLIFTFYTDEKTRKEIESQKLYAEIPAIKRGGVVYSHDTPFVTASSIINPLTVPWAIDKYLPLIDKAVATVEK
ncbi:iron-siderophore ABC transporter substrate-binding protein [Thermoactinospora rubra]|uniref:iron-siderophore ABC transporter substrate-binding protein n=1 Tax=Thermoactinospora rubra TaxID=1088767 RepID=UPI000A109A49|nr:iron-siderophore ABC transporter substrate-binding protein [Thermoactinospora rubra]